MKSCKKSRDCCDRKDHCEKDCVKNTCGKKRRNNMLSTLFYILFFITLFIIGYLLLNNNEERTNVFVRQPTAFY